METALATTSDKHGFLRETEELREMRALEEIERNPHISQRELAGRLGIALGIANACIQTLARKGLVKVRGENNRSISYHLTKKGLLHKARLAVEWTANTVDFYLQARRQVAGQLAELRDRGVKRALLYGANEVAELALMVAPEAGVKIAGVVAPDAGRIKDEMGGLRVGSVGEPVDGPFDAVVVCLQPTEQERAALADAYGDAGVYTLGGKRL